MFGVEETTIIVIAQTIKRYLANGLRRIISFIISVL